MSVIETSLYYDARSEKHQNTKNPSNGSRVIPCGQTDGETDMTKLIIIFRYFANAPKKLWNYGDNIRCYYTNLCTTGLRLCSATAYEHVKNRLD